MIAAAAGFLARLLVALAGLALLVALALVVLAGYVLTWPMRRSTPDQRKLRATLNAAAALVALAQVVRREQSPEPETPPQ